LLIESQLAPFSGSIKNRFDIQGPAVRFDPQAAQMVGLALHELATNASKYGALSVPEGSVAIKWKIITTPAGEERLQIHWQEKNGPPVSPPEREGFGHMVISDMVGCALDGTVRIDFNPEGLSWQVEAPPSSWSRVAHLMGRPDQKSGPFLKFRPGPSAGASSSCGYM
jgi:two-component system CheB/CheR fusion protein